MRWTLALLLGILVIVQIPQAKADPKHYLYQKMLRARAAAQGFTADGTNAPTVTFQTFQFIQILDHFSLSASAANAQTFLQRYFVDSTYAAGPNSPVILYLCGESVCDGPTTSALVNAEAKKYHAYRIAIEHRYYGLSQPFPTLTTDNLKCLSMEQALEDIATIQKSLQSSMGLTGSWIVVGGSYSGELSAFYRLKHPELVIGSLASSAPVFSKADFFEYDQHTATVAPPACLTAIQNVTKDVETKLLQTDSAAQVKALFQASGIENNVDFLYVVADMAATAIQYGFKDEFCNALATPDALANPTAAFATEGLNVFQQLGTTPLADWVDGSVSLNPSDYETGTGMRAWLYQSCTEFGYYQIANPNLAESARSQQITTAYHNDMCNRLFGITTPVNTDKTNQTFFDHLADKSVTNIFFTNGSDDPWSTLSLTGSSPTALANPALKFFTMEGASHCEDLARATTDAIKSAHTKFDTMLGQWLGLN